MKKELELDRNTLAMRKVDFRNTTKLINELLNKRVKNDLKIKVLRGNKLKFENEIWELVQSIKETKRIIKKTKITPEKLKKLKQNRRNVMIEKYKYSFEVLKDLLGMMVEDKLITDDFESDAYAFMSKIKTKLKK